jgi:hypothetical protein
MELAKGSILIAARQCLELMLSPVDFQRLLTDMPAPARELLDSTALVPSGRYPMERVIEMLEAIGRCFGPRRIARIEELGGMIAARQLQGMLRFLVQVGTVGATVTMLPKAWDFFFQGSSARITERGPQRFRCVVRSAFVGEALNAALRGFIREVLEQAGARRVEVKDAPAVAASELQIEVGWT